MDQVIIKDLLVRGIIGINDWERVTVQNILINIVLFADLQAAGISDDITDCVNYRTVAKKVQYHAENAKRFTVEALAGDIARICLEDSRVQKVRVRVEKPGAVRFASSVGVEIERSRVGAEN
jgi:FolB domain-containing protein